jgi:hypothetical protein
MSYEILSPVIFADELGVEILVQCLSGGGNISGL